MSKTMDCIQMEFTKHATRKLVQRGIDISQIEFTVSNPEIKEFDKFDSTLLHYVKRVDGHFLRVIGRWKEVNQFLVVTAFYDRRMKKRSEDDPI